MDKKWLFYYLSRPCNVDLADSLYIYLRNDRKVCNSMNRNLVEFVERKMKQESFDKVLFIQAVKLEIDKWLRDSYFKKEYGKYLPDMIDSATKYHVAKQIATYILYDFYRISL